MTLKTKVKDFLGKIKARVSDKEFQRKVMSRVNPAPLEGADFLVDYLLRVLIFLFPLYIYENNAAMGISVKDILFGIVVMIMTLWCVKNLLFQRKSYASHMGKRVLILYGAFLLIAITFAVQMSKVSSEVPHTYLYLGCFMLPFCVSFVGKSRRYYMELLAASFTLIYISIYRYIFTALPTLIGSENLLSNANKLIPLLLLGGSVTAYLYITEKNDKLQKVYLGITAAGLVILFLYGNMAAFLIQFLFIMCLQFLDKPTVTFMKKNMIMLFLYGFCASNAPLLTYFNAKGINKEFDLEYSIYIDIIIAILGLFVTSYWEKIPNDHGEDATLMTRFSKWYKASIAGVMVLIMIAFVFGSRGGNLSNAIGGKAVSGFASSLWNAVNKSNGELWHVLSVYGVIGIVVMMVLGAIIFSMVIRPWLRGEAEPIDKGFIMITVMFLIQSFFFPYSATSTPEYLIFAGFALCVGKSLQAATAEQDVDENSSETLEEVPATATEHLEQVKHETELENEKDISVIWVPTSVRKDYVSESVGINTDSTESEDNSDMVFINLSDDETTSQATEDAQNGAPAENAGTENDQSEEELHLPKIFTLENIRKWVPSSAILAVSAMVASLLLMIFMVLYRLFMPIGNAGDTDSMVQSAIERHEAELLAQAQAEAAEQEALALIEAEAELANAEAENSNEEASLLASKDKAESEASVEASSAETTEDETSEDEEDTEGEDDEEAEEELAAGISGGDYRIYDPNAEYTNADDNVTGTTGEINLRNIPSIGEESVVVHRLAVGETIKRTAIGANGWSKVVYNGRTLYAVTEYLSPVEEVAEAEEENEDAAAAEAAEEEARAQAEAEAAAQAEAEAAAQAQAEAEAAAAAAASKEKPKTPASYSEQWAADNKKLTLWSAGVFQGSMTVTDGDGNAQTITHYGDYYQGSGKDQKKYYNISVPQGESELTINVDPGFIAAIKDMGYSGLYFNKSLHNW